MYRRLRSFAILGFAFALLFTLAGTGQYTFLVHELRDETEQDLGNSAKYLRDQIAFGESWKLEGYRGTTSGPNVYVVLSNTGTLVDTHDFLPVMLSQVSLPFPHDPGHVVRFASDVGEEWGLYTHALRDGFVILGARTTEVAPDQLPRRLEEIAPKFGTTIAEALRTPERDLPVAVDYVIIDKAGNVKGAIGGIPLKTMPMTAIHSTVRPMHLQRIGQSYYASLEDPLLSRSCRTVGLVRVFEDVTDQQEVMHRSVVFNLVVAGFLWLVTTGLGIIYLRRITPEEVSCSRIPTLNESETVEFKASLRWDYVNQKQNRELEKPVIKTVAGFLNSEKGGTLIIGVSDNHEILGLEPDYSLQKSRKDRDGFEQTLGQILINAIGAACFARLVRISFCSVTGKEICLVRATPARVPIFIPEEKGAATMYVRAGVRTQPLSTPDAVAYATEHFGGLRFGLGIPWRGRARELPSPF